MSSLRIKQVQSQQMRPELRQVLRIEQANLLEMPRMSSRNSLSRWREVPSSRGSTGRKS
jgi:hypothetical protein